MRIWTLILAVVIFIGGLIGFMLWHDSRYGTDAIDTASVVSGHLTSRGGPFGDYRIQPRFCRSGGYTSNKRSRFGGGTLHANQPQEGVKLQSGSIEVRYIGDKASEHQVRVLIPGRCRDPKDWYTCKGPVLHARDCSRFDVKTERGRRVSTNAGIYAYSGRARLTCKLADSTELEADLSFRQCD